MVASLRRRLEEESAATGLPLAALAITALAIHVWVTLLAVNPWHPDEHFQILEFAWARAGLAPTSGLPWEWGARIRPALQPSLALGALAALRGLGFESPFLWVLLLRLAALGLGFAVLVAVAAHAAPSLGRTGRQALWLTVLFLWFLPLFLGRFTSENLAGIALAAALVLLGGPKSATRRDVAAGALLGLSFLFRYPMALAVAGVLAWLVAGRAPGGRCEGRQAGRVALAAASVAAAGTLLDAWFYGEWVLAPWNYFRSNLLEGMAARFGTSPWHFYLTHTPLLMAPGLGHALLALALGGMLARPRSSWTWAAVLFLVGHSLLAHKEHRFLLPLVYLLPVLAARGVEAVADLARRAAARGAGLSRSLLRAGGWAMVVANGVLLALLATPAIHRGEEFDGHYLRWLWSQAEAHPGDTLYVLQREGGAYRSYGLDVNVYRHARVRSVDHHPGDPLPSEVPPGTSGEHLFLLLRGDSPPAVAGAAGFARAYTAEPGYRVMARALGREGAPWVARLEGLEGWTGSVEARRVYRVHMEGKP